MSWRNFAFQFLGLLVLLLPMTTIADAADQFSGSWTWSSGDESFELTLKQNGSSITGYHSAVGQNGMKVDEVEESDVPSIAGQVKDAVATVKFRSGYPDSTGGGIATLMLHGQALDWQIVKSEGEHYLPKKVRLRRTDQKKP